MSALMRKQFRRGKKKSREKKEKEIQKDETEHLAHQASLADFASEDEDEDVRFNDDMLMKTEDAGLLNSSESSTKKPKPALFGVGGMVNKFKNGARKLSFNNSSFGADYSGFKLPANEAFSLNTSKYIPTPVPRRAPPMVSRAPGRNNTGRMEFDEDVDEDFSGMALESQVPKQAKKKGAVKAKKKGRNLLIDEKPTPTISEDRINKLIEEALKSEKTAPYGRTKLMVVGEGRAGKTSTIKSLLNMAFDANEGSTKGFDVTRVHASNWKKDNKGYLVEQLEKLVTKNDIEKSKPMKPERFNASLFASVRTHKHLVQERKSSSTTSLAESMEEDEAERLADMRNNIEVHVKAEEIKRYGKEFTFQKEGKDALAFSIWDFGGQKVFYSLHHLFLTEFGCYLLVFNVQVLLKEETRPEALEYLKFWLFSKKIHAPTAPILIVGTHAADLEKNELKAIDKILKKQVLGKNVFYEVNNKKLSFFPIDNRTAEGIETLRTKIEEVVKKQEYIKRCVPISFLRVIELLLESDEPYMSIHEAKEAVHCCGLDDHFFEGALNFLAQRGLITYFNEHETLRRYVILQPQWLISAITDIVYDETEHSTPEFDDHLARDFRKFETERVLTKELLTNIWDKKGFAPELQKFLIRVMTKSSLMCSYDFDDVPSFLVPSLFTVDVNGECPIQNNDEYTGPFFVIDFSGNYNTKIVKDDGRLYVRYMPYGFFERLVCLCVELSSHYSDSMKPDVGNKFAKLSFGTTIDFEVKVVNDDHGQPLWIKVFTEEDASMKDVRDLVQKIYSMIDGLKKDFFTKNANNSKLSVSLLLPSTSETGESLADYTALSNAFKQKPNPKKIRPSINTHKKVVLSAYRRWFCDEEGEQHKDLINPNADLPTVKEQLEKAPALQQMSSTLALPQDLLYHCFLSYKQSSAIDMVGKQYYILSSRGFKCWYDQQHRGAINLQSMMEGVKKSMCYVLFLSRDIFPSPYVEAEVKMAIDLNKPIILLHHPDTGSVGYWSFGDYIQNAPEVLKPLFSKIESIQLQRRHYLEEAVTQVISKRLQDIHSNL